MPTDDSLYQSLVGEMIHASIDAVSLAGDIDKGQVTRLAGSEITFFQGNCQVFWEGIADESLGGDRIFGSDCRDGFCGGDYFFGTHKVFLCRRSVRLCRNPFFCVRQLFLVYWRYALGVNQQLLCQALEAESPARRMRHFWGRWYRFQMLQATVIRSSACPAVVVNMQHIIHSLPGIKCLSHGTRIANKVEQGGNGAMLHSYPYGSRR